MEEVKKFFVYDEDLNYLNEEMMTESQARHYALQAGVICSLRGPDE